MALAAEGGGHFGLKKGVPEEWCWPDVCKIEYILNKTGFFTIARHFLVAKFML